MLRYGLAILAYLIPTFILGYLWHLVLFAEYYAALRMYRADVIIPFGFLAILIQGTAFALVYDKVFAGRGGVWPARALAYGAFGAALSWTYTTLAVAAKNVMTSVPGYLVIETAFTLVQWALVAPLTALAFAYALRTRGTAAA